MVSSMGAFIQGERLNARGTIVEMFAMIRDLSRNIRESGSVDQKGRI